MSQLWQDVRYGTRQLRRSPGFTAAVVVTLALGIGANTSVFSLVYGVLLRPLPFAEPDRLVAIWETGPSGQIEGVSPANLVDWRGQSESVEAFAALNFHMANLGPGEPEALLSRVVSPGFFALLAVEAQLGRTFLPEKATLTEPTVILSHGLWQRRFGSDPAIVGPAITLDGVQHTVVGVMPPQSYYGEQVELWIRAPRGIPAPRMFEGIFDEDFMTSRDSPYLWVVGRLAPGVTVEQAQAEMDTIAGRLADAYPDPNAGRGARVTPSRQQVAAGFGRDLTVLLGAVALVLLMACANIASLVLARGTARERELAIRAALGAGRARLTRQLLAESALLTLLGAGAGVLVAPWGIDLLLAVVPDSVPRQHDVGVDRWVLSFTLAISVVTVLVVGLMPALHASRTELNGLGDGTRATGGRSRRRLQRALVVAEVAEALVLLVGAGLLARSFVELRRIEPGFESEGVLVLSVTLPSWRYAGPPQLAAFHR